MGEYIKLVLYCMIQINLKFEIEVSNLKFGNHFEIYSLLTEVYLATLYSSQIVSLLCIFSPDRAKYFPNIIRN